MDRPRIAPGDLIPGAGGVMLVVSLFLPWYGVSFELAGFSKSNSATAREALGSIDMVLFLIALVAIAVVAGRAAGAFPDGPARLTLLTLGALGVLLVLYRIIDIPTDGHVPAHLELSRKGGIFIALAAAAAVAYGGRRTGLQKGRRRPEGRAAVGGLELSESALGRAARGSNPAGAAPR
jgi:hypothetical protein